MANPELEKIINTIVDDSIEHMVDNATYIKQLQQWGIKQRRELLEELAAKADKEYDRQETDNWLFSLGCVTHDKLLNVTLQSQLPKEDE